MGKTKGIITLFTFSTENWKRPQSEVNFLFHLIVTKLGETYPRVQQKGGRLRFMGRIDQLPEETKNKCYEMSEKTRNNKLLIMGKGLK